MSTNIDQIPSYTRYADIKRLDFIKKNLAESIPPNGTVLDVGCGNGIISLQLGKEGYAVHGIDMSDKSIENAKQKNPFTNVTFSVMDAETMRASGQRYDAIVCSEVLEHLNQPSNLVHQLADILQPNGILLVTVPNGTGQASSSTGSPMYKLIVIVAALVPIFLFLLRLVGFKKPKAMKQASSDLKRRVDYLVWAIMLVVGCVIVYSVGRLVYSIWN